MYTSQYTAEELRDVLYRNGFVPCDIPDCNCGSWHQRYGLVERFAEIKDELAGAGFPLGNHNGNNVLNALRELIQDYRRNEYARNDEAMGC